MAGLFSKSSDAISVFQMDTYTGNQKTWVLSSIAAISFVIGLGFVYLSGAKASDIRQKKNYVSQLYAINAGLEKNLVLTKLGDAKAYDNLAENLKNQDLILNVLKIGGQVENFGDDVSKTTGAAADVLNSYMNLWSVNKKNANDVLSQKQEITELKMLIERASASNKQITDYTQNIINLSQSNNSGNSITRTQEKIGYTLNSLLPKIIYSDKILLSNNLQPDNANMVANDVKKFIASIETLKNGSSVLGIPPASGPLLVEVRKLEQSFSAYANILPKYSQSVNSLKSLNQSVIDFEKNIAKLNQELVKLEKSIDSEMGRILILQIVAFLGFLSMAVSIGYLSNIFYNERNKAMQYAGQLKKNQANESAVQTLLKQMNPIDSGDLTREINVQDKFIEPIAKRVDATRQVLQSIITEIKKLTSNLNMTSSDTEKISMEVLRKTSEQLQLMDDTIAVISKITSQMDEIAQTTFFVKEKAISSEQISKDGLVTVNQAIEKMNQIRENIQESSKKIKRLGETSQSIVGVTDIIRHITKEINVLALNAAIQATNTGEGGKAFSIMAQEVQRLAENSTEASKQIDDLIKNIQVDTQAAVAAMEKTTQEVVEGTNLNDKAGKILNNIAQESELLAKQISEVTDEIEDKSAEMVNISIKVRKLQETNNENSEKVQSSVEKIKQMNKSSGNLSQVVAKYQV